MLVHDLGSGKFGDGYAISIPGKQRYRAIKKSKRRNVIKAIVGWLTFAARFYYSSYHYYQRFLNAKVCYILLSFEQPVAFCRINATV